MGLGYYWTVLRRRWWWLPLGMIAVGMLSLLASSRMAPTYRASARVLINPSQIPGIELNSDPLILSQMTKTYAELVHSRPILEATIAQLNLPLTVEELSARVEAESIRDTQILRVSVTDTDPARAAAIANRLCQVFLASNRDIQISRTQSTLDVISQELADLRRKLDDTAQRIGQLNATSTSTGEGSGEVLRLQGELAQYQNIYFQRLDMQQRLLLTQSQAPSSLSIVEAASIPGAPFQPHTALNTILGGLLGLLLAAGILLVIEYFDDRVRDPEELRRRFNLVPLAVLRAMQPGRIAQREQFVEAMRLLRANLGFVTLGRSCAIAITSALPGEGKTTIAANLALAEAQAGKRVVLIDADLRKPHIHNLFALENRQGLSTFLSSESPAPEPPLQSGPGGVRVLTSGPIPPNPSELLGSRRMAGLINGLRQHADIVILDSMPILTVADTLVLQRHVDGVVLVVDAEHTKAKSLARTLFSLRQASASVLGAVLNRDAGSMSDLADTYGEDGRHQPGYADLGGETRERGRVETRSAA